MHATSSPVSKKFQENDPVFDGFCHRGWTEKTDGWMNEMPDATQYPSVQAAYDTVALWEELRASRRRIWDLEQEVKRVRAVAGLTS